MLLIMDGQRLVNITSLKKFTGLAEWVALPSSVCRTTYTGLIAVKKASVLVSRHTKKNNTVCTPGANWWRGEVLNLGGSRCDSWPATSYPDYGCFRGFVKSLLINKCEHRLWLRQLGAGLSPRRPGVDCTSVRVRFVVDILALGQVRLRVIRCSAVTISPLMLHTHLHFSPTIPRQHRNTLRQLPSQSFPVHRSSIFLSPTYRHFRHSRRHNINKLAAILLF